MPDNKTNVRSYSGQYVDKDDIEVVIPVLMSPFLTTAPQVDALEAALCDLTGKKHSVPAQMGQQALHIACMPLE